ncbi:MAG: adenine phosphoribosyltransferase [Bacilli bacterium]|nr:adenine phosphoribosyltransferase [Bacilli bacterium]
MFDFSKYIADVPNFPIEGILFKDITPLLADGEAFKQAINVISDFAKSLGADVIAGPESRGFIFGCPVATSLEVGFVPIRKPNKLPRETVSATYDLEYGHNTLCMHKDAIKKGQKVVLVDDLLATGGTIKAATSLIESLGGEVVGIAFLIELEELKGREALASYNVFSILKY